MLLPSLLQTLTNCDLNPLTRDHLASPMPVTGLKVVILRILMVLVSTCLADIGRAQTVLMLICASYITYCLITTVSSSPVRNWPSF
jgi:threonine/homoserine/homoserine lactone efflux protein